MRDLDDPGVLPRRRPQGDDLAAEIEQRRRDSRLDERANRRSQRCSLAKAAGADPAAGPALLDQPRGLIELECVEPADRPGPHQLGLCRPLPGAT